MPSLWTQLQVAMPRRMGVFGGQGFTGGPWRTIWGEDTPRDAALWKWLRISVIQRIFKHQSRCVCVRCKDYCTRNIFECLFYSLLNLKHTLTFLCSTLAQLRSTAKTRPLTIWPYYQAVSLQFSSQTFFLTVFISPPPESRESSNFPQH